MESCQHVRGEEGQDLALETSPYLALVKTPGPQAGIKGHPPQVGPEITWFCLGSTTRSPETVLG